MENPSDETELLETCRTRAVQLLKTNLTPYGVLAASPTGQAQRRSYTSVFARDAAICSLGMAASGDAELEQGAAAALETLAKHQAANGQIPKFVDPESGEADFWYLGCIDSALWWLIAIHCLDRLGETPPLKRRLAGPIERAVSWLSAQEHPRFRLLQQNEASDWADIIPRSGFVLYTNALWYLVKRMYGLDGVGDTRDTFNRLFHPFSAAPVGCRRERLLAGFPLAEAYDRDLYLSFVNFSFFGDEGDVFGNVLAILCGVADRARAECILDALLAAQVNQPYPVRAVVRPIRRRSPLWRPYMARHGQNLTWQYHNGGIWPMIGGFWVAALARSGYREHVSAELLRLARACDLGNFAFAEWLHGKTAQPRGMVGQSWNAAAYLFAERIACGGADPFNLARAEDSTMAAPSATGTELA